MHKMFIVFINIRIRRLSWYRYETFITFFKFRFFDTRRERHNFSMLTVRPSQLTDSANARAHPLDYNCPGLARVRKINSPRLSPNLNSLLLFKITKNPSPSLPGMTSFTSPVIFSIWGFVTSVTVTSSPHAREHLHSMCAPN